MKLGLQRGTVELHDHDRGWEKVFAEELNILEAALGDLCVSIEHVGSSAVQDLKAKPILDIAVAIACDLLIEEAIERLKSTGYLYRGNRESNGGFLFVKGDKDSRYLHLHLLAKTDPQWPRYLRFRDILRESKEKRKEYEQLKVALAIRYPNDRERYTTGKNQFIERTLAEDGD